MFTYSIIIPHKNIPHLLSRCLDSIPLREDVQVIVVDDNSDPRYLKSGVFPGLNRQNVEVIFTKEGKGAGYARNIGLQRAVGKWLLLLMLMINYNEGFLDALDKYKDSDVDVVYFCANYTYSSLCQKNKLIYYFKDNPLKFSNRLRSENWEPWNKMFRRDFVKFHNLNFEEIVCGNDAMFVLKAGYYARTIAADTFFLYTYVVNRKGSISSIQSDENKITAFDLYLRINDFYRSQGNKEEKYLYAVGLIRSAWNQGEYKLMVIYLKSLCKYRQIWRLFIFYCNYLLKNKK